MTFDYNKQGGDNKRSSWLDNQLLFHVIATSIGGNEILQKCQFYFLGRKGYAILFFCRKGQNKGRRIRKTWN